MTLVPVSPASAVKSASAIWNNPIGTAALAWPAVAKSQVTLAVLVSTRSLVSVASVAAVMYCAPTGATPPLGSDTTVHAALCRAYCWPSVGASGTGPVGPVAPVAPCGPCGPCAPTAPGGPGTVLSAPFAPVAPGGPCEPGTPGTPGAPG